MKKNAMVEKRGKQGFPVNEKDLEKNKKDFEDLNEYFWQHIKRRIGKPANRLNGTLSVPDIKWWHFSDPMKWRSSASSALWVTTAIIAKFTTTCECCKKKTGKKVKIKNEQKNNSKFPPGSLLFF